MRPGVTDWLARGAVIVLRVLARLPLPLLFGLGQGLGRLLYWLGGSRRAVAQVNLRLCLPELDEAARRRIVRAHFGYLGVAAVCQGLSWCAGRARLRRLARIRNRAFIDDCLRARRPVIVLVPHFVALELAGTLFTALVHPGMFMYQRIRNPVFEAEVKRGRTRFGGIAVERHASLHGMVRALQRGIPLFYLPDQDAGKRRGVFVPLCGELAATVPTLGRLARLTQATVIPAFARFLPRGAGVELRFAAPLAEIPSGDDAADAAMMNQIIEAAVRTMPEQYFWVHRRFKTRPPGAAPVY